LTFALLTLKLVRIIARGVGNLPTNFGVSGTFRSRNELAMLLCLPADCDNS